MITSSSNAKVRQVVQWQTKAKQRREDGVFIAEGFKMLEEAPEEMILEVYLTPEMEERIMEGSQQTGERCGDLIAKLRRVGYEVVSPEVFGKMSDTKTPQGALVVCRQPGHRLEDLLQQPNPLLVLLEDIQDPGNLGTIVRTGEGAGITGVIMSANTVDLYNPKTIRSTMGSVYRVPCVSAQDMSAVMDQLHKKGIATYAAHLEGSVSYDSADYAGPSVFLIGNEGKGLSEELATLAQKRIRIPMAGKVESLNAGIATALLMYEAVRQRNGGK